MHKRYVVGMLLMVGLGAVLSVSSTYAIGSSTLVISQAQLGTTASASNEFIEVYNTSSDDVEVTNWCLYYASATSTSNGSKLACFVPDSELIHLFIPSYSYIFAISTQLATFSPMLGSDIKFSATMSATAGHIRLIDNNNAVIDKVAWGVTAIMPEGLTPAIAPSNSKVMQRISINGLYQDTDENSSDFELAAPRTTYTYGSIYELQDLCNNIDGIQIELPDSYSVDTSATCTPPPVDLCMNIDGLQVEVPDGYALDDDNLCQPDVCLNIDDVQIAVPTGYMQSDSDCWLDLLPVYINELLPNAIGSDIGNEFIELYNPNTVDIELTNYRLQVGETTTKTYAFPVGAIVQAGGYESFTNDDIAYTLINTTGRVVIISADGQIINESPVYENSYDGISWELYDGVWQYSDQPTPAAVNIPSRPVEIVEDAVTGLAPCAPNQYRNPETNRCRLVVTIGSTITPCKDGQYRSEETNRCRNIASAFASLLPCGDGQERNSLTNRCRSSTLASDTLVPCKENQQRSLDTNRCNAVTKISQAGYAPQPVTKDDGNNTGYIALATVVGIALAYVVWEWRDELTKLFIKMRSFMHHSK